MKNYTVLKILLKFINLNLGPPKVHLKYKKSTIFQNSNFQYISPVPYINTNRGPSVCWMTAYSNFTSRSIKSIKKCCKIRNKSRKNLNKKYKSTQKIFSFPETLNFFFIYFWNRKSIVLHFNNCWFIQIISHSLFFDSFAVRLIWEKVAWEEVVIILGIKCFKLVLQIFLVTIAYVVQDRQQSLQFALPYDVLLPARLNSLLIIQNQRYALNWK